MKSILKIFGVIFLSLTFFFPQFLSAQDAKDSPKHEISAATGVYSGVGLLYSLADLTFSSIGSAVNKNQLEFKRAGSVTLEYYYQHKWWFRFGVKVGAEVFNTTVRDQYGSFLRHETTHIAALMPSVQFSYLNYGLVKLYSGIDLGVSLITHHSLEEMSLQPSLGFNLTAIGIRVGNNRAFGLAELNLGYDSFGKIGIGVRF